MRRRPGGGRDTCCSAPAPVDSGTVGRVDVDFSELSLTGSFSSPSDTLVRRSSSSDQAVAPTGSP